MLTAPKLAFQPGSPQDLDSKQDLPSIAAMDCDLQETENNGPDPKDYEMLRAMPEYTTVFGWPEDRMPSPYQIPGIQDVVKVLELARIPCFLTGHCALIYYGVPRIRSDWEVCVPSEKLDAAVTLFIHRLGYEKFPPAWKSDLWDRSLLHTFFRFKLKGFRFFFYLIPSDDQHMVCEPTNVECSGNNLPYPTLPTLAQSFVDTYDGQSWEDLIDGMDLSEEWGRDNLNLSGTNDVDWAKTKNVALEATSIAGACIAAYPISRKEIWDESASRRRTRGGPYKYPPEIYATRFRLHANRGVDVRSRVRPGC